MRRRFLPTLNDDRDRPGAYATQWEGWVYPRDRKVNIRKRVNVSFPSETDRLEDFVGCYAILYKASPNATYTAYIGFSTNLRKEVQARIRRWGLEDRWFAYTAAYISNSKVAREYELDLIRYYCPPWNTKYFK